jgi:hypothetical protein
MGETTTTYDLNELLGTSVGDMTKSEPLPEGVYHCRVAKAEIKHPKDPYKKKADGSFDLENPNFPYVNYDYVVTGGSPEEYHGRHVFEIGTLKPGATFVNRQVMEACGFSDDTTLGEALPELNTGNRELLLALAVEAEGKGKDGKWYPARNKIAKRLPLSA